MLMAAGIEPLPRLRVHGYLLVGGEKMSKTRLNQIAPAELIETFGVDGVRYHFLRDTPFGPDGDFSYEGMIARYNADLANQLGNLLQRVSTVVHTKCGGIGPAPRADSVLRPHRGRGLRRCRRRLARHAAVGRARSHLAHHPRDQRLPPDQRALEDGAGSGLSTPSWATRSRRCASWPSWPARRCLTACDAIWRAHRAGRLGARPATARGGSLGRLPGWAAGRRGRSAVPSAQGLSTAWRGSTTTATCDADDDDAIAEARAAGVTRAHHGRDRPRAFAERDRASPTAHDDVWATAGVHPHDATQGLDGIAALLDHPKVVAVGEAGLDYYYDHSPRDVQQSVFAAQIALAHERDLPLVIHTRDAWDDTFRILDREGMPRRTVFHCFTGGPDEATAALDRAARSLDQRHRHVQDRRRRARRGRGPRPSSACSSRPTRPILAPVPAPGPAQSARAGSRSSVRPSPPLKGLHRRPKSRP